MEGVNLYMSLAEEVKISHEVRGSKDVVILGGSGADVISVMGTDAPWVTWI